MENNSFITHFFDIHILLLVVLLWQGFSWSAFSFASGTFGRPKDVASGLTLPYIFVIWSCIVAIFTVLVSGLPNINDVAIPHGSNIFEFEFHLQAVILDSTFSKIQYRSHLYIFASINTDNV